MIVGVGTDVVALARIERVLTRFSGKFLRRVLTPAEREQKRWTAAKLARRWALKEAVAKALGTGIGAALSWQDIQVSYGPAGQPLVTLAYRNDLNVHVSASDDAVAGTAVAFCVLERRTIV